jgi:tyrosyl-tRNA synthetase
MGEEPLKKICSSVENIIGGNVLCEKLHGGKCLTVKLGVDPTRPDLTFCHMVVFNRLGQFQDLGHEAILLIADYATMIGDPSGRSDTWAVLSQKKI